MSSDVEVLVAAQAQLAEGPLWLPTSGEIAWVDILRGRVHRTKLDTARDAYVELDEPVGAVAETIDETLVAATPRGLRLVCPERDHPLVAVLPSDRSDLRMNDGKADPVGRYVGGTMTLGEPKPGLAALWSFEGPIARRILDDVTISNGLCWSTDGRTMYYIDTPTRRVDAFDYDVATGDITDRRTCIEIDDEAGAPDGMCADSEGGLWVALWGGGRVCRFVDGRLDDVIRLPTPFVTSVAFCGDELERLVITTAAEPYGAAPPPGAGHLYHALPGVAGCAGHRFRLDGPRP